MKRLSSTKQPPDLVFFTDRDLGRVIPEALERAGVPVERHDNHFGPNTTDVEWLREIGKRGWVALTHNKYIRYNPQERNMAMRARVPLFMLIAHYSHGVLARNLIHSLPAIYRFLAKHQRPFIAKIYKPPDKDFDEGKPGRIELWLSYDEWTSLG